MEFRRGITLKNIYISNYKNLIDCNLEIQDFAILVGSNNSGKSNFVEIFEILYNIFFGGEKGREYAANIMYVSSKPTIIKFEYEAIVEDKSIKAEYEIKLISKLFEDNYNIKILNESCYFKSISATGKSKKLFFRSSNELELREKNGKFKTRQINPQVPVIDVLRSLYPDLDEIPDVYYMFIPLLVLIPSSIFTPHKMSAHYNNEINKYFKYLYTLQTQKDEKLKYFKNYFLDILELEDIIFHKLPVLNGISKEESYFMEYRCTIKEKNIDDYRIIEEMSDGTKILFLMLYNLFINLNPLICIEEPEIGLHPKALSKLLQLFFNKEVSAQAIITTHSPYILNLVNPRNVFVLEAKKNGMYSFTKVSTIKNLEKRLKSKYVDFGDLFVENFQTEIDTILD